MPPLPTAALLSPRLPSILPLAFIPFAFLSPLAHPLPLSRPPLSSSPTPPSPPADLVDDGVVALVGGVGVVGADVEPAPVHLVGRVQTPLGLVRRGTLRGPAEAAYHIRQRQQ